MNRPKISLWKSEERQTGKEEIHMDLKKVVGVLGLPCVICPSLLSFVVHREFQDIVTRVCSGEKIDFHFLFFLPPKALLHSQLSRH